MNTATDCLLRMVEEHHELEDYQSGVPRWCTGCGDNAILSAVQRLCRVENLRPEKTVFVSGIGCSSRFPHYMRTYGFHGIHGRALPIAEGVKMTRPDLHEHYRPSAACSLRRRVYPWLWLIRQRYRKLRWRLENLRVNGATRFDRGDDNPALLLLQEDDLLPDRSYRTQPHWLEPEDPPLPFRTFILQPEWNEMTPACAAMDPGSGIRNLPLRTWSLFKGTKQVEPLRKILHREKRACLARSFVGAGNEGLALFPLVRLLDTAADLAAFCSYWKATDGTGKDEFLGEGDLPASWSADGKTMVLQEWNEESMNLDIAVLALEGDRKPAALLQEKHNEAQPRISPHDGRWMAYTYDESGRNQVFVRPFPDVDGGRWQVSTSGGDSPLWSPDGRELFFRNGDAVMSAPIETDPAFSPGTPRRLVQGTYVNSELWYGSWDSAVWDISPDGRRFLMMKESGLAASGVVRPGKIHIVLNRFDSVVANIATRPGQILPIFDFCRHISGKRIAPLISVHPDNAMADVNALFVQAAEAGIRGVKLHPMYQGFFIDDRKMYPLYQLIEHFGFFVVFHTGFDIAFPGNRQADVERVKTIANEFRELTIIATHVGGWRQWDRAGILGSCENVYTETSMTLTEQADADFVRTVNRLDEDRVLDAVRIARDDRVTDEDVRAIACRKAAPCPRSRRA